MPPLRRPSTKRQAALGALQAAPGDQRVRRDPLEDEARFLRSWFERPLVTGSVTPSGKMLARTMASYVDPRMAGPVIELGPGTVLAGLIRKIDRSLQVVSVGDAAGLDEALAQLAAEA